MRLPIRSSSIALALALAACGASQEAETTSSAPPPSKKQPADKSTAAPSAGQPQTGGPIAESPQPVHTAPPSHDTTAAQPPAQPQMSDGQIAAYLSAANKAEIESSELATTRAKSPEVKKLAAEIIKDHKAADQQAAALLPKAGIKPEQSAMVTSLGDRAKTTIDQLKILKGADFDRAYVDAQIMMHQDVIEAFDQRLMVAAHNEDLKIVMSNVRPKLQAHLDLAQRLQAMMAAGAK
jgi:putative membrane protein